jgi:hypothetical protein
MTIRIIPKNRHVSYIPVIFHCYITPNVSVVNLASLICGCASGWICTHDYDAVSVLISDK